MFKTQDTVNITNHEVCKFSHSKFRLQQPSLLRLSPSGPSPKSVANERPTAKNIINCLLTNHRPRTPESEKYKTTTPQISHRHNPEIRHTNPNKQSTYTANKCTRHAPHRILKLQSIHTALTVKPLKVHKKPIHKHKRAGHHSVSRKPIPPERFLTQRLVNKRQKSPTSGKWTHGRNWDSTQKLGSSLNVVVALYNMQQIDTWILWAKIQILNLFTTHGITTPNPTADTDTTHKLDESIGRLVIRGPLTHHRWKNKRQLFTSTDPQHSVPPDKPAKSHRENQALTPPTRPLSTKLTKFLCNRFLSSNEKRRKNNIVDQWDTIPRRTRTKMSAIASTTTTKQRLLRAFTR